MLNIHIIYIICIYGCTGVVASVLVDPSWYIIVCVCVCSCCNVVNWLLCGLHNRPTNCTSMLVWRVLNSRHQLHALY